MEIAPHALKRRKLNNSGGNDDLEHGQEDSDADPSASVENISTNKGGQNDAPKYTKAFEMNAGESYSSNMFKLQMDELLMEVKPNYEKRIKKAENALRKLKDIIERIPQRDALSPLEAERQLREISMVQIPFPEPRPQSDVKYTLSYEKPANVNIIGSYALKTAIMRASPLVIDMAVTMPSNIFQDKDYLNYRYFHKRAYYLACITAGIQETRECGFALSFDYQNGNPLQPVLLISPNQDDGADDLSRSETQIRILLAGETNLFPMVKTLPEKNCVRLKDSAPGKSISHGSPTPMYNSTLRAECCVAAYLKLLHEASVKAQGFKDACILGTVWLQQRGLGTAISEGGFGHFELASMIAILTQGGGFENRPLLSLGYSSYQIFKAFLQFLAGKDLSREPFVTDSDVLHFPQSSTPMFFDGTRALNILFKMSPWSYQTLRYESLMSLKVLGDSAPDQFRHLFISNLNNPVQRFDSLIRLSIPHSWKSALQAPDFIDRPTEFCTKLHQVLSTGLGDRARLIDLRTEAKSSWATTDLPGPAKSNPVIVVGALVKPEHVGRAVDHGPAAQDKIAATAFRKFWGEKAELRRFKDGSILESLVWSDKDSDKSVLQQIVIYVVQRHIGGDAADSLEFLANDLDRMVLSKHCNPNISLNAFQPLLSAYEGLEKRMREIEGLPLQVRQISAADADLRYASVLPQGTSISNHVRRPMNVVLQFEGSARWPDDIAAIQRTKAAFLLNIGELLDESIVGSTSRLGLEAETENMLNSSFLDVIYSDTAAFRLRIHHDRELTLLERQLKDNRLDRLSREQVALAISAYKRNFIHAPLHTQALRTLCTRFPLLSPTIRLMKKWRDSHLLSSHISDELIELLTIRTFVHPYPWRVPGSVRTGFLRTLTFIAKWDWRLEPFIVDMSGEMTSADISAINLQFEAWRKIDPAMNRMVMFTASNLDPHGITWTEQGPSKVVATRFTSLTRVACNLVKEQGLDFDVKALFATSFADYDFVIHLNNKIITGEGRKEKQHSRFKNLQVQSSNDLALVGYDPLESLLEELKSLYGSSIVFFHNASTQADPVIAGLWSPQTTPRIWRVHLAYSTMPVPGRVEDMEGESQASINKAAILGEISRLGGDMILRIEKKGFRG